MNLEAAILAWLMQRPIHKSDIGEVDRYSRMSQIAEAIGVVSGGNRLMAASLAIIADEESAFRRDVQTGNCPKHECDEGLARGPWQLRKPPSIPRSVWLGWAGNEYSNALSSAVQASSVIRYGLSRCKTLEGAMALYATGNSCFWSRASSRASRARELAKRLL